MTNFEDDDDDDDDGEGEGEGEEGGGEVVTSETEFEVRKFVQRFVVLSSFYCGSKAYL